MSNVPLRFRDWWVDELRDYDMDFDSLRRPRTSRLLDQHFGTTLRKNDLLSSLANTHISRASPYFRPYDLSRQDSGSTVNAEKDKFQIILDVQQFTPDEISVKTNDKFIIVEGKHEEKPDEHGFISR
jgi:crystallin, alpha B